MLPRVHEFTTDYKKAYYGFIMAATTTEAYMYATKRYHERVSAYLLNNYLSQGIKNGFLDYEISGNPKKFTSLLDS
jgi:hypothetical protein